MMKYWLALLLNTIVHFVCNGERLSKDEFGVYADTMNLSFSELLKKEKSGRAVFIHSKKLSNSVSYYWIKIQPQELQGYHQLFLSNYFERIEAYTPLSHEPVAISGNFVDFKDRTYSQGFYRSVIPLPDSDQPLYVKLTSSTGNSIFNRSLSHVELATTEVFQIRSNRIYTTFTLMVGMEFIILVINLFLFFLKPTKTGAFYCLVILIGILLVSFQNQIIIDLMPASALSLHYAEMLTGPPLVYFYGAFTSYYLKVRQHMPMVHKLLIFPSFALIICSYFIGNGLAYPILTAVSFVFSQVLTIIFLTSHWNKNSRLSRIFIMANTLPVLAAFGTLLALNGLLVHTFLTTNAVFLGFMLRDTVFTIDLVSQYFALEKGAIRREVEIEQLQEEKEQLKRIEELKTRFFNNVSHELRTPLTLILSPLEKTLKSDEVPEKLRKNLDLSLKNGKYLQQLVNEMLDLAKLDKGELHLIRVPLDVVELLHDIRDSFKNFATEKGQSIFIATPQESIIANLDQDKLEKIMINLVSNAIKYSDKPGKVMIKVDISKNDLSIEVSDEGIGISESDQTRIFDRYYQSDQSQKVEGTGIGLSIVKEFVELHKGKVSCSSVPGKGTTMTLTFPDVTVERTSSNYVANGANSFDVDKSTIMIVEDHHELRDYLKDNFRAYNVVDVADGKAALERMSDGLLPDLVLTDYVMPHMNGYELVHHLKDNEAWRDIPIMFLTARTLPEDKVQVLNLGVDDYITKPFDLEELEVRVNNMIKTSRKQKQYLSSNPELVEEVIESGFKDDLDRYLSENLGNSKLSNNDLAYHFGLSERNLYRKIKAITGQSPASYLREIRLQKARRLLETNSGQTVGEIAIACGIDNLAYFSQTFKKRFGKLPSSIATNQGS